MTYEANVFIANNLEEEKKITAVRPYPVGEPQFIDIAGGNEEQILHVENRQSLTVRFPDIPKEEGICFKLCAKVNLEVTYSRDKRELAIHFKDTDLKETETPTTVNVTVGDEDP